jgi:hypothetical protein
MPERSVDQFLQPIAQPVREENGLLLHLVQRNSEDPVQKGLQQLVPSLVHQ